MRWSQPGVSHASHDVDSGGHQGHYCPCDSAILLLVRGDRPLYYQDRAHLHRFTTKRDIRQTHSDVQTENTVLVVCTSGSTGKPKGIMIEHRGLCTMRYYRGPMYMDHNARVLPAMRLSALSLQKSSSLRSCTRLLACSRTVRCKPSSRTTVESPGMLTSSGLVHRHQPSARSQRQG